MKKQTCLGLYWGGGGVGGGEGGDTVVIGSQVCLIVICVWLNLESLGLQDYTKLNALIYFWSI